MSWRKTPCVQLDLIDQCQLKVALWGF
uniref:Uncharacterized protein n=1 Tax=Anguilla anguilla TaxID=7936 RepID=A0A0E9RY95_ANGAN